jgi:hypothetical protein
MKNLTILLAVLALAFACEKEKPEPDIVVSDIMIRGQVSLKSTVLDGEHLTLQEIAEQATQIVVKSDLYSAPDWVSFHYDIFPYQRDIENGIIILPAVYILDPANYQLTPDFIKGKDIVIIREIEGVTDTIAYIPNSVVENAHDLIMSAYENEDYQEVYDLFKTEFVFIPITGSEYKSLEGQGLN